MVHSSHSSLSSLARADFIERTISAELDVTHIYDDTHPKPSTVPQLKYAPSRLASFGPPSQTDSPQLSQRSGSNNNMRNSEDYPPTGKMKRVNSSTNRYNNNVPDDVSVVSQLSTRSNNSQIERIAVGPSGAVRDRSPAQNHLLSPQQLQLVQQQQVPIMPPLHMSSPPHPQYKQHMSLDHMVGDGVNMEGRVYNRSYSDPMSINNSNAGKNPPLLRNNVEQHQMQQQQAAPAGRIKPVRNNSNNNSSVSSISVDIDGNVYGSPGQQHPQQQTQPQQLSPYFPTQYAPSAGSPATAAPRQVLSRQNSNASVHSNSVFPYPRDIMSHPYHMEHIRRQARSPIPFGNYISILDDARTPDDVALDLGLTLSKQESVYGCNMFEWFDPSQDENEVKYLMELGFARNTAIEMIFDRSRRRV